MCILFFGKIFKTYNKHPFQIHLTFLKRGFWFWKRLVKFFKRLSRLGCVFLWDFGYEVGWVCCNLLIFCKLPFFLLGSGIICITDFGYGIVFSKVDLVEFYLHGSVEEAFGGEWLLKGLNLGFLCLLFLVLFFFFSDIYCAFFTPQRTDIRVLVWVPLGAWAWVVLCL